MCNITYLLMDAIYLTIADHLSAHLFRISTFTNFEEKSTAIGTTFTLLHSILYMAGLEERVLEDIKLQQRIW